MHKLQNFIYGLKQAFKQWYPKFDEVTIANGFKKNIINQCILIFLVLYVNDIFLASNDTNLLVETKQLLFSHFDVKDLRGSILCLGYTDITR